MWNLLIVVVMSAIVCCSAEIGSYDYDNKIEETVPNDRDNLTSNVYVLPDQIFNDGKPFFVKKDASGTIDFSAKTTPESLPTPAASEAEDFNSSQSSTANGSTSSTATTITASGTGINSTRKHDISLDNTVRTQNIHDYLNLPVKYQSSKFVYPLMSSSYANLKYQGNNKNYISNHKFDSSTIKSVAYTTKKYRPTYSTKSYTTAFTTPKTSTTESYSKGTATVNGTQKYSSIPPRSSTPNRRFSTLNRVSSTASPVPSSSLRSDIRFTRRRSTTTTSTTTTTTTPSPIEPFSNGAVTESTHTSFAGESIASSSTISSITKSKNATDGEKEPDSMNIGDFFSYFFNNNEESDETEATRLTTKATALTPSIPSPTTTTTTVTSTRPVISTTHHTITAKDNIKPIRSRYNATLDSATRRPYNRTAAAEYRSTTVRPTLSTGSDHIAFASTAAAPQNAYYGDKTASTPTIVNAGNFRPPTKVDNIRVSPGAQTATFITNGHGPVNYGHVHPFGDSHINKGQFQAPAQNNMKNIVVLPESNSASFVATSQLQTTTRFDQKPSNAVQNDNVRRPIANLNAIDETTKPGITFFSKGQVTSAEAYDNPNQSNVVFHGQPSSTNSNHNNNNNNDNIVIAPGTNTASFVTSSQLAMDGNQSPAAAAGGVTRDQQIKNVENEINAYGPGIKASQRPHGFQLPSTTAIPKQVAVQSTGNSETQSAQQQHIRFPSEHSENGEKALSSGQPETAQLTVSNNTIKFPSNHQVAATQPGPAPERLVKFTDIRNEISGVGGIAIDPNNYKQIIQTPNLPGSNFVVFRPQQPPMAVPQAPLVMGLTVPQIYRNPAFVFKKPTIIHYPRKNYSLPNILPQFRPTQTQQSPPPPPLSPPQLSITPDLMLTQLRQGQLNRPQYVHNLRYKPAIPILTFNGQRPMQIRPMIDQATQNRRHFELHPGNFNRIYERPMLQTPPHIYNGGGGGGIGRHPTSIGANALLIEPQRFEENMKVTLTNSAADMIDGSKNPDFENGDGKLLAMQQQKQQQLQQTIVESQKEIPKVEPVTTLQMIQHQRLLQQKTGANAINGLSPNRNTSIVAATVAAAAAAAVSSSEPNAKTDKPLYVVYPMQKSAMATSTNGINHHGEIATILAEQKPATAQQLGLPYTLEKHKSRYILNSRPAYEYEQKSDQEREPIAAENDEEDR